MYNFKNKYKKIMNKLFYSKRGFSAYTFAELMISLVVIAVITVILYPTLADMAPNNNKYLFKSAYRSLETITSDVMNTSKTGVLPTANVCETYCNSMNTMKIWPSPGGSCTNCTAFRTSNGMRWAFTWDAAASRAYALVDVNAANNTKSGDTTGNSDVNQIPANAPDLDVWDNTNGVFYTTDNTTCDTFLFQISPAGKITPHGAVAANHMQSGN